MSRTCTPSGDNIFRVENQTAVDALAECATINGTIFLSGSYTGPFYLPNVRNITGDLSWERNPTGHYNPAPSSIDLPDLQAVRGWYMGRIETLANVSAPKLETVHWSLDLGYVYDVDLRSWTDAELLRIAGNLSSLRLDSLREIRQSAQICNMDNCDSSKAPTTALDVFLPSLETVGDIEVQGKLSNLAIPKLREVRESRYGFTNLKVMTGGGPPIDVAFPQLEYVGGSISLEGDFNSLSLPKLNTSMDTWFVVRARDPLDINLPFEEASFIHLAGNISSVQFPNLRNLTNFLVESDLRLDCKYLQNTIMAAANKTEDSVRCESAGDPSSISGHHLSLGEKIGTGVVVSVVGLVGIIVALLYLWRRQQRATSKRDSNDSLANGPPSFAEGRDRLDDFGEFEDMSRRYSAR
ncbi:hypothetical protein BJX99DRAFT_262149 [Aspergillus californicus]